MTRRYAGLGLLLLVLPVSARAQATAYSVFPVDPIALLKHLLGPDATFTASAQVSGEGPADPDNFHMDTSYAVLHDWVRTETDLAKLRSRNACDIAQGRLQEIGMDDTVMILLPELKMSYVVYPRAHAYVESPLTWRERLKELAEVQVTELGPDTVDRHPCVKYRLLVTNVTGDDTEVLVWKATDLKNFPIQMRFEMGASKFNILFQDVRLERPDISAFQPPVEFDRYTNLSELVRSRRGIHAPVE